MIFGPLVPMQYAPAPLPSHSSRRPPHSPSETVLGLELLKAQGSFTSHIKEIPDTGKNSLFSDNTLVIWGL